jgi:hypothetical protein
MNIQYTDDNKNRETLQLKVDTKLKEIVVDYVGHENNNVKNNEVTVENIVETMADEFPEFLLAVAEENWIRGYHQALHDVDVGEKIVDEENKST